METSINLLEHLAHQPTDGDWQRLLQLYRPLLRAWMVRAGVAADDIDDLTQDLLLVVLRKVSQFKRMHQGAFRSWLRSILAYRLRDYYRAHRHRPVATGGSSFVRQLAELESPDSALSRQWDREHDEYLLSALMSLVQKHFTPLTWEAFRRQVLEGQPAADVAAQLGLSLNSVLLAKSRVLKRLRLELVHLTERAATMTHGSGGSRPAVPPAVPAANWRVGVAGNCGFLEIP